MIDEAFVTAHQGNIAIARQKAINIFYSMALGIGQPQSIGLTDRFLSQGYDVVFNHVNFTVDIAPNSWNTGSNTNEWAINIRNYWNSPTKRCISKDIMILFTGQNVGIDGFHSDCNTGVSICQPGVFGSSHVVVVRNQENYVNTAKTLAHEILHAFGLGHLNEILTNPQTGQSYYATVCHTQCALGNKNNPPALMCVYGGNIKFTSCDINCIDRFFTNNKCICLNQQFGSFPDDFICPPPDNLYINIVADRPNPVIGCRIGEDEITFEVNIINNSQQANRNIRAFINVANSEFAEFVIDPDLDFNCITTIPGSRTEFRIVNNVSSDCNAEVLHPFAPNETKVFRFKVRYKGGLQPDAIVAPEWL